MRFGLCNLPLVHILVEIYGNHKTTVSTIKDIPPKERLTKLRHKTSSNKVHSKSISNLSLPISIQFCAKNERYLATSQPAITCSKLTIETLEQDVKCVTIGVVLVSLLLTLNIFHTLFHCFFC